MKGILKMSMQISIRASDPASGSRAFPWPVLEAGNGSFIDGVYSVSLKQKDPGKSFFLTHEIKNAELVTNWIHEGKVRFVCSVATPVSAYRKLHISDKPRQVVKWEPDDLGSYPFFTPMIVTAIDIGHTVDAKIDGVDPLWDGRTLNLLKGSRIAICSTFALQSGVLGLLDFCLKEDFESGQFQVEPSREGGFKFKVHLAEDLLTYLKHHRRKIVGGNIMTHIVSAALTHLKQDYDKDDGEEGWESYNNLDVFAKFLEEKQLGHWSDDDFEPEAVATRLYPIKVTEGDTN